MKYEEKLLAAKQAFTFPTVKNMHSLYISDDTFEDLVIGDEIEGVNGLQYVVTSISDRQLNGVVDVISIDSHAYRASYRPEDISCVLRYKNNWSPYKSPIISDDELPYVTSIQDVQPKCNCGAIHADWKIPHSDWCWLIMGVP